MQPSHVPSGHCRSCGYPMDPGRCPECGTICPDVSPVPRWWQNQPWRMFAAAVALGAIPLPVAWAISELVMMLFRSSSAGMLPGDHRIAGAWMHSSDWSAPVYGVALPVMLVIAMVLLVRTSSRRGGHRGFLTLVAVAALTSTAIGWFMGLALLALTIWNE